MESEYIKDIEYNGITYGLLEDNSIIDKENSEKVGFFNDGIIEIYKIALLKLLKNHFIYLYKRFNIDIYIALESNFNKKV